MTALRRTLRRAHGRVMSQLRARLGLHLVDVYCHGLVDVPARAPTAVQVRVLEEAELLAHAGDAALDLTPAMVGEAFARGHFCVGALAGDRLVGYVWGASGAASHKDGVWLALPHDALYGYKSFVRPSHRGTRLAIAIYRALEAHGLRRGCRQSFAFTASDNHASAAALRMVGGRCIGWVAYWRTRFGFFALHSAGVRGEGLRFHLRRDSVPVLEALSAGS